MLENNLSSLAEAQLNKCINSHDLSLTFATAWLCPECRGIHKFEMQGAEMNIKFKCLNPIPVQSSTRTAWLVSQV